MQINFAKKHRSPIEVTDANKSLMDILLQAQVPVASSCHGEAVCGKCRLRVLTGADHLLPANEREIFLREKLKLANNERISCQTFFKSFEHGNNQQSDGEVIIDAGYW